MSPVSEDCFLHYQMHDWVSDKMLIYTFIWDQTWEEATRGNIFLNQEASNTSVVQRLLLLARPGPITAHWEAYQQKLRQNWEWAFLAPWDTMAWNAPKLGPNLWPKGVLPTGNCTCHLPLQRLIHDPCKLLTLRVSWKEFRVVIRGMGKNWKNRPSDSQTFSGKEFYEPKFLHLLILR